ncbi:MAG: HNH endonuclease [Proteobacteria bacterium]|nr:HNH endonuclease [Pseudomonadota bacterium]
MDSTLLLNSSYEPIKIISWERAITLLFLGKVEVVDNYEREVKSVSLAIKVPAVVRLLRYIHLGKRKPPLTRFNLLARDNFQCQYCTVSLTSATSTIDHVVPRSQGGTTCWQNIVIACHGCNRKKGGRTPYQAKMKLLNEPIAPDWLPVLTVNFNRKLPTAWLLFLSSTKEK